MYELLILGLLVTIVVAVLRGGKPVEPLIVHSTGRYHITLAPQLGHQQAFLEQIAGQFSLGRSPHGDLPAQYYEVTASGSGGAPEAAYLLAISLRKGTLYFQAIVSPPSGDAASRLKSLRDYSEAVLAQLPVVDPADASDLEALRAAVPMVALQSGKIARILV